MNDKKSTSYSKYLSLILRHDPAKAGIELDKEGWADVQDILSATKSKFDYLCEIVETNNKKRFEFNSDRTKIRACQGHNVRLNVDLGFKPVNPPDVLYHGTSESSAVSIKKQGLLKKSRQHVHLSVNRETAIKVGQRHGKPFVFKVDAKLMHDKGHKFFLSHNGVWLVDSVPPLYLISDD